MKIRLKNIGKKIKHNIILKDINMELESGHIYGFVGTNGSGKTMLMRILTGLISFTEGEFYVDERSVQFGNEIYYDMGVIIEKPEFFNELTGLENLEMLAKLKNIISREEMIDSLNKVGLDPYNPKKVKEYSLGMKQRLGIAQAIMENPDILILDEVTNGLDEEGIAMVYEILSQEKEKEKLIIISSHYKQDIESLCDRIFLIKNQTAQEYNQS
ncbi:ATP-binding cassette domain-containing protein [Massilimicrobiota timonensis]|uniref:ATP-binding cassette domain-containing protein n=1 Tax=Massilimicrobiota timonensis TaxID=1776392 RepID=A0ABT7UFA9_9FIRM|nr:ATP-binding cassette domain-containing protein [Massilimicrobiota timonensis]MDM8194836.1 ATP-binding cassette domain-containing protein [Massilimicrobiota timonensis]